MRKILNHHLGTSAYLWRYASPERKKRLEDPCRQNEEAREGKFPFHRSFSRQKPSLLSDFSASNLRFSIFTRSLHLHYKTSGSPVNIFISCAIIKLEIFHVCVLIFMRHSSTINEHRIFFFFFFLSILKIDLERNFSF